MRQGLGEWKKLYQRALAMSSAELADRLRQQATARLDWLRYRIGIPFEPRLSKTSAPAHFFFSADAVPSLCARARQLFPAETDEIIQRAEQICKHQFDLLGYRALDYGPEIDWHCDRVHGIQAPRKPWFQIRYLDFAEVGDSKVTWELNRHQHFVTLAKAFRLTGNEKFASELFAQWRHWHRENPYPIGINWASSLEVSFRSLSWIWFYFLMSGSRVLRAGFRSELCRKLAVSGRHIESHLSTYFSPNTHLLGEALALFFIGTLFPELPHAARWQRRGWQTLQREAERQLREDGLHFEQSLYYHVYTLDFFLHASVLASLNGIPLPVQWNRRLECGLEALCVLGRAGSVPRLGDDDGGRLFDGQRNRTEHLLDPLSTAAVMFRRGDFKRVAGGLREETLWLLGEAGAEEFERLPMAPPAQDSTAFAGSGLYLMTAAVTSQQLVIDAGPQGADTAGHGHADALSITANRGYTAFLIDPGTFEYLGNDLRERNRFRGTKAHNTLTVDGLDQSEPNGPFNWGAQPNVAAEKWINGETFDFFVGSHDGYKRLANPVVHRRSVFFLKSRFWLVRDQALGQGTHQLDLFWHLHPELLPVEGKSVFRSQGAALSIRGCDRHGWFEEVVSEDWSPAYGEKQSHNVLHFRTRAGLPAEFVTLLLPLAATDSGEVKLAATISPAENDAVASYHLQMPGEDHWFVFGSGKPWTVLPWTTDAEFFYWGQSCDNMHNLLVCCNASYIEAGGKRIVDAQAAFSRCEIIGDQGRLRVACDRAAVVDEEAFLAIFAEWRRNTAATPSVSAHPK